MIRKTLKNDPENSSSYSKNSIQFARMDEELIKEVEQHAVIYNRQKYFLNNTGPGQYETKDEAWNSIAIKLHTDVETCKKRWKYLRERYVQQLKQGVPPSYEHLSRPYLEKMKFLDQHIQPRKSYRNVSSFLPSPNGPMHEYMDSRSNGSVQNHTYNNNNNNNSNTNPDHLVSIVKFEPESFQGFPRTNTTPPNPRRSPPPSQPIHNSGPASSVHHQNNNHSTMLHSTPYQQENVRGSDNEIRHIPSSSSSLKSPLSSPQAVDPHEINDAVKRARLSLNTLPPRSVEIDSSDNEETTPMPLNMHQNQQQQQQQQQLGHAMLENERRRNSRMSPTPQCPPGNNDLLYSIYQRFAPQNQVRCSEQLVGELVTSELLKMNRERRKQAQRRILEVLFFDD